jgi:hypothetical protein
VTGPIARVVAIGAALLLAASCADDGPTMTDAASSELQRRTAEIRQLATDGQPEAALARLAELDVVVDDLLAQGALDELAAASVLDRAASVVEQLQQVTTTTTTTTAPPPTQPPPADDDDEDDDEDGRGNGNGNGRDRERDD